MPKLIVADGGQKKAFKLSKGRLTLGSGEGDKLKLSGSEPGHAVLVIDADGGTLDANAEVTIDGAGQTGSGLRLEFGSKLKIGGAVLMLTADEGSAAATKQAAPKAGAKKRASAPAGGAARSSARAGSSRSGNSRSGNSRSGNSRSGGRASAAKSGGAARGRSGGGRRGASSEQKQGLPGWAVPTIVVLLLIGVGGAWFAFGGGGNVGNYLAAAEVGLNDGDFAKVKNALDSIDESRLGGSDRSRYNDLAERFEQLKRNNELTPRRNAGFKWIGEKLESFADRYIDKKDSVPPGPARVFLERVEEFKTLWPEHNDPVWTENADGKKKLEFIADRVRKYEAVTRLSDPITYEELAWAHEYYMANQNFRVLMPKLRGFLESSPDELDASLAQGLLESAKLGEKAFVDEYLGKAKEEFEKFQEPGGETFPMRTASKLHAIVLRADDPQRRSDAVNRFLALPGIEEILQAYDKNATETFAGLLQESLIAAKWDIVKKNRDAGAE